MSDKIALTSSMRSNLLSLKNTQTLLDRTQDRLSTGYKVNSAMDNPSSYFTAQSLNSRASDLSTLLDSIGQAISTLEVADEGITTLQDFVEQAKSIANSARDTANVSAKVTSSVKFDTEKLTSQLAAGEAMPNAVEGDTMTIRVGDSTKLTGTTNVRSDTKLDGIGIQNTMVSVDPDDDPGTDNSIEVNMGAGSIKVDGKEFTIKVEQDANSMETAYADATYKVVSVGTEADGKTPYTLEDKDGNQFTVSVTTVALAAGDFADVTGLTATVSEDGKTTYAGGLAKNNTATEATGSIKEGDVTINVKTGATVEDLSKVLESMIGTTVFSAEIVDSNMVFSTKDTSSLEITGSLADAFGMDKGTTITLDATDTAESLRQKIESIEGVKAEFDTDGHMIVKSAEGDDLVISGTLANKLGVEGDVTNGNNERAAYAKQFNNVLTQMDELVQDTSYKGINLLNGDNLTVNFNESRTSTIELKGVTFNSVGLGFTQAANEWIDTDSIDTSLDQITKATSMLRAQASEFGQNLSTVQIREDFTQNMINNLQTGADKLTLADMNEEAANMLALQTRQQLGVNSLSLASQASQSVLQLF